MNEQQKNDNPEETDRQVIFYTDKATNKNFPLMEQVFRKDKNGNNKTEYIIYYNNNNKIHKYSNLKGDFDENGNLVEGIQIVPNRDFESIKAKIPEVKSKNKDEKGKSTGHDLDTFQKKLPITIITRRNNKSEKKTVIGFNALLAELAKAQKRKKEKNKEEDKNERLDAENSSKDISQEIQDNQPLDEPTNVFDNLKKEGLQEKKQKNTTTIIKPQRSIFYRICKGIWKGIKSFLYYLAFFLTFGVIDRLSDKTAQSNNDIKENLEKKLKAKKIFKASLEGIKDQLQLIKNKDPDQKQNTISELKEKLKAQNKENKKDLINKILSFSKTIKEIKKKEVLSEIEKNNKELNIAKNKYIKIFLVPKNQIKLHNLDCEKVNQEIEKNKNDLKITENEILKIEEEIRKLESKENIKITPLMHPSEDLNPLIDEELKTQKKDKTLSLKFSSDQNMNKGNQKQTIQL